MLAPSCLSVRLFAYNNSRVLDKFYVVRTVLFVHGVRKVAVHLQKLLEVMYTIVCAGLN
jgi:hypothetical protein